MNANQTYSWIPYNPSTSVMKIPAAPTTILSLSQLISGSAADPNAAGIKPLNVKAGARYEQDPSVQPNNQWSWSVAGQTWYQTSQP